MMKRKCSFLAALAAAVCLWTGAGAQAAPSASPPTYAVYLAEHAQAERPEAEVVIPGSTCLNPGELGNNGAYVDPGLTEGRRDALIWASGVGEVQFPLTVEQAGLYEVHVTYLPLTGREMNLEVALSLDGQTPYDGAESLILQRMYAPVSEIQQDTRGNDIRPRLKEVSAWQTVPLTDDKSHYAAPYLLYVDAGEHVLSLEMKTECMAIAEIRLCNPKPLPAHAEYLAEQPDAKASESIVIQAENAVRMSSQTLYPLSERANAATQPSHPVKTRMNTIGGSGWKQQGQWLEWEFTVPESGLYHITLRALQNYSRGMTAMRSLSIDGQTPFAEAAYFGIPYRTDWQMYTLGGDTPLAVYLEEGTHTLRMQVEGSFFSESLRTALEVADEMNRLYRQIITITGDNADADRVTIDLNRDFQLERKIPGFLDTLTNMAQTLRAEEARIAASAGSGSEAAILVQVAAQMESFAKKPETVPSRLEAFKGNLSSLTAWALQVSEQPVQLDYITFTPVDQPLPTGSVSFWDQVVFRTQAFLGSFTEDYNAVGQIYDEEQAQETLTVWVCANDLGATGIASGRDQTQLIKELIDQTFVPETGIQVNLSLIDGSTTLMQATLGNKGPDVALTVYKELPVNLAMRGALVDLQQFEGYDEVVKRFMPSAMIPYEYQGGVYALPETQNFYMTFYRKDIFEEMGLEVPETWDDVRALVPLLSTNAMRMGVPEPTVTNNNTLGFQMFLFQHGLNYYTEDLSRSLFDQPEALDAFVEWTDLYTRYSLPVKYDFFSRFRTGEMPIALDHYTMANTLAAAAPELDGLWDIAPIPGTRMPDGSIDRSEGAMGTGAVIMAASKHQEAAFKFISWWTSDETQTIFGQSLENLMGAAARWPTANIHAFQQMRWTQAQKDAIWEQWQDVDDIPQLPGNYIINRNLSFAFRAVVYDDKIPREVLAKYNKEINKEIARKWAEFQTIEEVAP